VLDEPLEGGVRVAANVGESAPSEARTRREPWRELAHVLLSSSEVLYVD
jgi:hypothetical protein